MMAQAKRTYILMIKVNELFSLFCLWNYLIVNEKESIFSVFLLNFFNVNLLAFHQECCLLIGFAIH